MDRHSVATETATYAGAPARTAGGDGLGVGAGGEGDWTDGLDVELGVGELAVPWPTVVHPARATSMATAVNALFTLRPYRRELSQP